MLHILHRDIYTTELNSIYQNPLQVDQSRISILNLFSAVGLQLTRSSHGHNSREAEILKRLDADRAELFYLNATFLNDPTHGFEDGDITSIQSLLLITVFMLTVAKRNAAWAYFGMAVRSAYALGLHRWQTSLAYLPAEQRVRRNVWKSLYIMDCFISAMLGRPNGIDPRDAPEAVSSDAAQEGSIEYSALDDSMNASKVMGEILSRMYAERRISVKLAHHFSGRFQSWKATLPRSLHWKNISPPDEDLQTTLAQLHVNLAYFHGIILLTRPFFLQKIISTVRATSEKTDRGMLGSATKLKGKEETSSASAELFSQECVRSAVSTVDAVQIALLNKALPRRDPFIM
jgi:hypothetical protein